MRRKRLFWQLYLWYVLIAVASVAVVTWYASRALRRFHETQMRASLQAPAILAAEQFRGALIAGDTQGIDSLAKRLGSEASTRLTVVLSDGTVVGDTDKDPAAMDLHDARPELIDALAGRIGTSIRYSITTKVDRMYVAAPVNSNGRVIGAVRVSVSTALIEQTVRTVRLAILGVGLLTMMLALAAGLMVIRRISRPLGELRTAAEKLAAGNLTHRVKIERPQEFASMAETFNQMAGQLHERIHALETERNERGAILASMVEGVLAVDRGQRLLEFNQVAANLLGVDPEADRGRTLTEAVRNPTLQELVDWVLEGGEPAEEEVVIFDGGERFLQAHGSVLRDASGNAIGVLVVLHDVTRLRRLEQVRRDFAANVSHELKTPVTAIKGFVETLLDGALDNANDARRFLGIVAAQAERLGAIIEDLMELAHIEQQSEREQVALRAGKLREVLDSALDACRFQASEKNVKLELDCPKDVQARIDANLLERAVFNLLDNAVKYSPPGATVEVAVVRDSEELRIDVRDVGCGIAREHLPRIFERFYRVDKARSRQLGGTGLGLAIVKHIAQAHQGRASVNSKPGEGSTFSIHLPLAE